jgi:adiponectin receptor
MSDTCCHSDAKPIRFFRMYPDLETLEPPDTKKSGLHALAHDDNIYLITGYRKMPIMNWLRCIQSAFTLHNDTVNIWTHLIPGLYFLYLAYDAHEQMLSWHAPFQDRVVYVFFALCCAVTMLVSSVYHIFRPHSEGVYHYCLMCDLRGIILLLCGGNTMSISVTLKWFPRLRSFLQIVNMLSFGSLMLWIPTCVKNRLGKQRSIYFALYAILAGLSWVLRHIYIVFFYKEFELASLEHLFNLSMTYGVMAFGLVMFSIKFPERSFPKKFDLFGASHQIFHVFVVIGSYISLTSMLDMNRKGVFSDLA